jgi:hypothetical protein
MEWEKRVDELMDSAVWNYDELAFLVSEGTNLSGEVCISNPT